MSNERHGGHDGHHDHHDHHDHHGHHDGHHGHGGGGHRGPEGTQFLDLEPSKVLLAEADGLLRECVRDLLRESMRAKLRERFGEQIDAVAQLAVDVFVEDASTSLAVEALIEQRKAQRADIGKRLAEITAKARSKG